MYKYYNWRLNYKVLERFCVWIVWIIFLYLTIKQTQMSLAAVITRTWPVNEVYVLVYLFFPEILTCFPVIFAYMHRRIARFIRSKEYLARVAEIIFAGTAPNLVSSRMKLEFKVKYFWNNLSYSSIEYA